MQKIIGSIIVISVCTALGFEKSRELQLHLKELEELKRLFMIIHSELKVTKATLSEIFLKVSKKTETPYKEWLKNLAKQLEICGAGTFSELWKNSIQTYLGKTTLRKDEIYELEQVGLGIQYIETLEFYLNQLDFSIQNTREELKTKKKLYQSMGIMCGIYLVIVLF